MSTFDAKSLRDKDDNDVNFTPTHYFDGGTKKNIAEEIGKKQDTLTGGSGIKIDANNMISASVGRLHPIGRVNDSTMGETSPYGDWVVDLESPNANAPGGYDRLTVDAATSILDADETFLLLPDDQSTEYFYLQFITRDSSDKVASLYFTRNFVGGTPKTVALSKLNAYQGYIVFDERFVQSQTGYMAEFTLAEESKVQPKFETVEGSVSSSTNKLTLNSDHEGKIVVASDEVKRIGPNNADIKHVVIQWTAGNNAVLDKIYLPSSWKYDSSIAWDNIGQIHLTAGNTVQVEVINNCCTIREFS